MGNPPGEQQVANASNTTPTSWRADSTTLAELPTELRLEIFNYVFANVPGSYGYTTSGLSAPPGKGTYNRHGMVLVNKEYSLEYRQAFYERTCFFLRIDSSNAFDEAPSSSALRSHLRAGIPEGHIPNFWNAPLALLQNLRHCTLYIEIGEFACAVKSPHSVSTMVRAQTNLDRAREVRQEMRTFHSLKDMKANDVLFDSYFRTAIHALLRGMLQLRTVHLVWDCTLPSTVSEAWCRPHNPLMLSAATEWTFETMGQPFVEQLKGMKNVKGLQVVVNNGTNDKVYKAKRGEAGVWEET